VGAGFVQQVHLLHCHREEKYKNRRGDVINCLMETIINYILGLWKNECA
jgi:hypothetical protein